MSVECDWITAERDCPECKGTGVRPTGCDCNQCLGTTFPCEACDGRGRLLLEGPSGLVDAFASA